MRYLIFVLFFTLTVIYPVHKNFDDNDAPVKKPGNEMIELTELRPRNDRPWIRSQLYSSLVELKYSTDFLWIYVVFVYLFSVVAMYMIVNETIRIIRVRQRYLGTQSSVTDRTIRLSGIPAQLRSEEKIRGTIENLEIGKVESVTLCRNWQELDDLMAERIKVLRRLEAAWIAYLGPRRREYNRSSRAPLRQESEESEDENVDERSELLGNQSDLQRHIISSKGERPTHRIWFGSWNLQSRKVDAIDHHQASLQIIDEKIKVARQKEYEPTPMAFVTLDTIASCVSIPSSVSQ